MSAIANWRESGSSSNAESVTPRGLETPSLEPYSSRMESQSVGIAPITTAAGIRVGVLVGSDGVPRRLSEPCVAEIRNQGGIRRLIRLGRIAAV